MSWANTGEKRSLISLKQDNSVPKNDNVMSTFSKDLRCWRVPGGVLGPKTDGGVPLAAENWTQKDRGKNRIWGQKDRILWELVVLIPQKIVLVLVDEKKYPKKIEFDPQNVKKGVKTAAHMYHPSHREYPPREYDKVTLS